MATILNFVEKCYPILLFTYKEVLEESRLEAKRPCNQTYQTY